MIGLIGRKIGMTQVFDKDGKRITVTVVQAGPCGVVHRKTVEKHGYDAVQLGYEEVTEKKLNKPKIGHLKKHNSPLYRYLKEFRLKEYKDIEEGEVFDVSMFVENEIIEITGKSKGKGFTGVMKRHGFHGFKATHGVHESYRGPGSIGQCATPARVFKGKKLPGHKGVEQISIFNVKVVKVDIEKNLILVKGAVPGHRNSIIRLRKEM
ncbi:MAG: 50S ribosomal protein L3 [Candidatus Cloacimonetes bacterium]|jgi:large subunit ribosomal protein L3|nr:50S ribosomal protein L3 [Candidatus Cloacimonadota bacterium]MBT6993565.1 50S ribosomal protein L3 [Candidatus Cloacimonadota bacterium]MBT7470303.1 50S ribosomal protein L3 [Candidatus Cloacimonadota bacterium]